MSIPIFTRTRDQAPVKQAQTPDDLIPLTLWRQMASGFDGDLPAMTIYVRIGTRLVVKTFGAARTQFSALHAEIAHRVLEGLYKRVLPETGGSWVVAWGNPDSNGFYTRIEAGWKDADGDLIYTVYDVPLLVLYSDRDIEDFIEQAYNGWHKAQEFLNGCEVDERHKSKIAQGERQGPQRDWGAG